jgi:transcriptional regulator with XRE-family HTH domain
MSTAIRRRLIELREQKNISAGEIEKRASLPNDTVAGVENGSTIPSMEILEKLARALDVPLHQLFYSGCPPPLPNLQKRLTAEDIVEGKSKVAAETLSRTSA